MATKFLEPGGDAMFFAHQNVAASAMPSFFDSNNPSNVSVSTTAVHGGHVKSLNCASAVGGGGYLWTKAVVADAGARVSFYINIDTIPNGNLKMDPIEILTAAGVTCFGVTINTAGKLAIYDKDLVIQATGSTVLSVNTWYRISLAYIITNGTTNTITVYLNGVSEVIGTNLTVTTVSNGIAFGFLETSYGATGVSMYFSDFYVDDSNSGDTGNIWVTAKRPNANGTTNGFSTQIGSGGSGYGTGHSPRVNERAGSLTNGWSMVGAGSAITEEYNIEGKATGDIDISTATIVDSMGWVWAKSALSETASIIVGGSSSNISLTSNTLVFTKIAGSATYPAGTGTDIGIQTSTTVTTVSLYECGVIVAYIPAAVANTGGNFFQLFGGVQPQQ